MPQNSAIYIALLLLTALFSGGLAWLVRSKRTAREKAAINAGWQEQMEAQRTEHRRLVSQNKSLMDQVSQFQASNRDAKNRAKELADAVKTAYARRDELQREIKDVRSSLEMVLSERDKLRSDIVGFGDSGPSDEKDEKIFQLSRELENWQQRLPPLLERFRLRNEDAEKLEADLATARQRIEQLERQVNDEQTRIEAVRDPDALTDGRDASNDDAESNADSDERQLAGAAETDSDSQSSLRDDLQLIKGVGPAIEKTLNDMGFFRLQQIADMTEYDIDRVAERLRGFHSRIYRENWIGQARELTDRNQRA